MAAHVPPEALVVKNRSGSGSARTSLRGWYLRVDRSAAVDTDGNFYLLHQYLTFRDRIFGATLEPTDPPLVLGYGGRDGEAIDLTAALTRILPTWQTAR